MPAQINIDIAAKEDFPPVSAVLAVLNNTLDILKNLDRNSSGRRGVTTVWKVFKASLRSPFHLEFLGSARRLEDVDNAEQVIRVCIDGFRKIESEKPPTEFPPYFDELTLRRAKGLVTVLDRDIGGITFSALDMTPVSPTQRLTFNVDELIGPKFKAKGTLEGVLQTLSVRKRNSFNIFDPLTDARIICYFSDDKLDEAKSAFAQRVAVYGQILYNKYGKPVSLHVEEIRRLRSRADLPQAKDIDIDITDGADPTGYIRRLRDGE